MFYVDRLEDGWSLAILYLEVKETTLFIWLVYVGVSIALKADTLARFRIYNLYIQHTIANHWCTIVSCTKTDSHSLSFSLETYLFFFTFPFLFISKEVMIPYIFHTNIFFIVCKLSNDFDLFLKNDILTSVFTLLSSWFRSISSLRIIIHSRPRIRWGFPSTMSSDDMFSSRI